MSAKIRVGLFLLVVTLSGAWLYSKDQALKEATRSLQTVNQEKAALERRVLEAEAELAATLQLQADKERKSDDKLADMEAELKRQKESSTRPPSPPEVVQGNFSKSGDSYRSADSSGECLQAKSELREAEDRLQEGISRGRFGVAGEGLMNERSNLAIAKSRYKRACGG